MNFVFLSDPHITSRIPRGRLGNPLNDAINKLHQVFKFADYNSADIMIAGDLFDTPRDIVALFAFLDVVKKYSVMNNTDNFTSIFAVYGQHDMYFRNKNVVTNLGLLERAGIVNVLDMNGMIHGDYKIFGCSWNEDIPEEINNDSEKILLIHAPIYKKALFPNHEYIDSKKFAEENSDFKIIHCGDIHRKFKTTVDKTTVLNTGPMMRLTTDEYMMKHKPGFYFYNGKTNSFKFIKFNCKPVKEVLNKQFITDEKESFLKDIFIKIEDNFDILQIIEDLISKHENNKTLRETLNELMGNEL